MNQSRTRRAPAAVEAGRSRTMTKASGDTSKTAKEPQTHEHHQSKKIPKSVRYDLQNALVGLCDVWFEEIKPHLLRNNIKVHVPGGEAAAAGGDRGGRPSATPGCSHLDPGAAFDRRRRHGASSAGCCSTQPTASRARSRKPRQRPLKPRQSSPTIHSIPKSPRRMYEQCAAAAAMRAPPLRRPRQPRGSSTDYSHASEMFCASSHVLPWLPPRSYSSTLQVPHTSSLTRPYIHRRSYPFGSAIEVLVPAQHAIKLKMKDASVQTDDLRQKGKCLKRRFASPSSTIYNRPSRGSSAPKARSPSPDGRQRFPSQVKQQRNVKPAWVMPQLPQAVRKPDPAAPQFRRKQSAPSNVSYPARRSQPVPCRPERLLCNENIQPCGDPLFQDDLVDIIGPTYDKKYINVKGLKDTPRSTEPPATLILTPSKNTGINKRPPWK